jgi:hypothetical protein
MGILKIWRSLEILLNSKWSNLIFHLELRIKVNSDNWFFGSIDKQLLKISSDLKLLVI